MIIIRLAGGLGNQMFQYAFGRALATRLATDLLLDVGDASLTIHNGYQLSQVFKVEPRLAAEGDLKSVLGWQSKEIVRRIIRKVEPVLGFRRMKRWIDEASFHYDSQMLEVPDNTYLCGYWQSELYFRAIAELLRSDFRFRNPPSGANAKIAEEIAKNRERTISIHVRRGDYVNDKKISEVYASIKPSYYRSAMDYFSAKISEPYFLVFSDDTSWAKSNLSIPYRHRLMDHNQGNKSYEDLRLMSLCKHHIIANSSFSWWGAWLNGDADKITVAPSEWFADTSRRHDLYPSNWTVI